MQRDSTGYMMRFVCWGGVNKLYSFLNEKVLLVDYAKASDALKIYVAGHHNKEFIQECEKLKVNKLYSYLVELQLAKKAVSEDKMKIYAAGEAQKAQQELCEELGVNKLFSFLAEIDPIKRDINHRYPSLMIDSGAHSWNKQLKTMSKGFEATNVDLPEPVQYLSEYKAFIKEYGNRAIFVELDIYGHVPKKIIDDFYFDVLPYTQLIRVYHPLIDGGSLKTLKKWIDQGVKYVGVSGESDRLLKRVFQITRDKIKVHGFAMSGDNMLANYPFYSVDSTSTISIFKYGARVHNGKLIDPAKAKKQRLPCYLYSQETLCRQALEALLKREKYYTKLWEVRGVKWEN